MVHINDLPSDILLDLLSWVPGRDLVRNCRLVCLQWQDLVDLATLWKRKCLREGFDPETPDRSVPDWRIFYFLCIMKRNLIKNPCGEDGFNFWEIESHNGDKWRIEELPGARRRDFPHQSVPKYFVTSQGPCTKHQLISLKKAGYWDELMDKTKPDIVVKDWSPTRFTTTLLGFAMCSLNMEARVGTACESPTAASPLARKPERDTESPALETLGFLWAVSGGASHPLKFALSRGLQVQAFSAAEHLYPPSVSESCTLLANETGELRLFRGETAVG
ncbi:F-box only protein 44-like isoform X1 [Sphaerodactylus townsendi]|uniref:F-box only protein 44-like isoform X1 n=1 Tax=Sphaerodactylus townsendi TaxID=933632 RepID=UPI00202752EB|nr:F-box only protein 44-like isoform X1 [Sphaerodactylus townsendi]